jgi:hypothetical protein
MESDRIIITLSNGKEFVLTEHQESFDALDIYVNGDMEVMPRSSSRVYLRYI